MAQFPGPLTLDQAVGADDGGRSVSQAVIDNQQMVGDIVEYVAIALSGTCPLVRARAHFLIEDTVAEGLNGIDLVRISGKTHAQVSGTQLAKRLAWFSDLRPGVFAGNRAALPTLAHSLVPLLRCCLRASPFVCP